MISKGGKRRVGQIQIADSGNAEMKNLFWLLLVYCISFTSPVAAFENQIGVGVMREDISAEQKESNGPTTEGDYDIDRITASYTRFLSPVEDNGEPLDLLPFFYSRTSYLYADLYSSSYDFERDDIDYSSEKDWSGIRFGGRFYIDPNTGIGVELFDQSGDWEEDGAGGDSYDEDWDGWNVSLRHYLDDHNRVAVRLSESSRQRDYDDGYERSDDYQWLVFGYDGVLGQDRNIFLGIDFGQGSRDREESSGKEQEHDLTWYGITAGPVYRQLAIYFSWEHYDWDPKGDTWKAEETYYRISPRYWFDEQLMLGGDVYTTYWKDWIDGVYDYRENGTGIEIIGRYRF